MTTSFEAGFSRLFTERFAPLFRYLAHLTGDGDAASDAAQDALLKLYQRGILPEDAGAWLVAVAHNHLRDQQRSLRRRLSLLVTGREAAPGPLAATGADVAVEAAEQRDRVRAVLGPAPPFATPTRRPTVHPTDSDLLALLHGELRGPAADQVRLHLDACPGWASRRDAIGREEIERDLLLRTLDFPVPPISAAIIRTRASARRRLVQAAASIGVLTTLASAAAAMPGSPIRTWLENVLAPAPPQPAPAAAGPAEGPAADGVEVAAEGALVIELRHPQAAGQFQIAATDRATATVRAIGGDVGYRVGPGRVTLDNRTPATRYEITIPRTLANVTVLVGGRILWRIGADHPAARVDTLTFDLSLHQGRLP